MPLSDFDPVLGPVHAAHASDPTKPAALALLTAGLAAGIDPKSIRAWTANRGRSDIAAMTKRPAWAEWTGHARARLAMDRTDLAQRTAARLVAWALAARPASGPSRGAATAGLVVGLTILRDLTDPQGRGFDTALLSGEGLALTLNVTPRTARGWLAAAPGVRAVGQPRRGVPTRYRIAPIRNPVGRDAAIRALVEGGSEPLADALRSALDPARWWGEADRAALWVAVADAAGIDPQVLGVPTARARAIRKAGVTPPPLPPEAEARLAAARAADARRRADRVVEVRAHRARTHGEAGIPIPRWFDGSPESKRRLTAVLARAGLRPIGVDRAHSKILTERIKK